MEERVLVTYIKSDSEYLLAIVNGDEPKVFTEETEEAVEMVNAIKKIIE